jgi:hypothetical protein
MASTSLEDNLFETSPFSLVADELAARCWSGRQQTLKSLEELRKTLSRRADSSLDLIWASLGAGKTHTLLHFSYLLQKESGGSAVPAFIEMPEQVRNFVDIYKRIAAELPLDQLADLLIGSPRGKLPLNLERAGNVLKHGTAKEKDTVRAWLYAEKPHLSELRACSNISERIEGDLTATEILQGIVKAFDYGKSRLILLIDEFQRIGVVKPATTRDRILSALRTVFSRSPRHFSVIFATQSSVEQSALELIPPELKTLMGRKPSISLPEMDVSEAEQFVLGRFKCFRPAGYAGDPAAPFQQQTIPAVLTYMRNEANIPLSPREILQALVYISDHSTDVSSLIKPSDALQLLKTYDAKQ